MTTPMNDDALDTVLTQLFMAGTVDYSLMEAVAEAKAAIQTHLQGAVVSELKNLPQHRIAARNPDMKGVTIVSEWISVSDVSERIAELTKKDIK